MAEPRPLHLAVALDGTGFHPASWRDPSARAHRAVHRRSTGRRWRCTAERGLLDFLTIEDSFGLQSSKFGGPDGRTDQVRGRLDAVLIASLIGPVTRRIGLVPTAVPTHTEPFHLASAIATLDYVSNGRAGWRPQVSGRPSEAAHVGFRTFRAVRADRTRRTGRRPTSSRDLFDEAADAVEVVRRLWDSWEDDADHQGQADRPLHRPRQAALRRLRGTVLQREGPVDRAPPAAGPAARRRPRPLARSRSSSPPARPTSCSSRPPTRRTSTRWVGRRPRPPNGRVERPDAPLKVFADLVVFLDDDRAAAERRKEHLDALDGHAVPVRRGRSSSARPASSPTGCSSGRPHGLDGFRLRPGVIGHDLDAIVDERRARAAAPRRLPHRVRRRPVPRAPRTAPVRPAATQPRRSSAARSRSPDEHQATEAGHPRRLLPRREQHHGVERPAVEEPDRVRLVRPPRRRRPSAASSTSSSSPRACGCASSGGKIHDLDTVGRPDTPDRARRAGGGHHPPRPRRHAQRHVPRALRARPPAGHARPPVRRPGGVERRHVVRRVHRRELPPRRLPRLRRPLRARRRVRRAPPASCGTRGPTTRSSPTRTAARSCATGRPGAFDHHGPQFDIHGHFNVPRSPQRHPVILQAGDSDGGRELAAATADAIFSRHNALAAGPGVLRRRQGPAGQVRPRPRRPEDPSRRCRSCSATRRTDAEEQARDRPPPAGQPADRDPAARAGVEPRPVGLRRRGSAARHRPGRLDDVDHPGPGPHATRIR